MRTFAKALFVVVALIAFTALTVYAYLSVLDPGEFRDDIAKVVKSVTGRELSIEGDVSFKIFPAPKLLVEKVSLSNAKWGARSKLISVDEVIAEVALVPLFSRTISIKRVVLIRPVLNLERNARGESNWNLWNSSTSPAGPGTLVVDVSNVDVRNGRISYLNHGSDGPFVLRVQKLKLSSKGLFQPLDVWFTGQFNKRAVRVRGETGSLASLFKNEPFPIDLRVSSGGVVATLDGGLKQPMELRGLGAKLTFKSSDFGQFLNIPASANRKKIPLAGEGRLRDKNSRYVVDKLELAIGTSDLGGSISFGVVKGRGILKAALSGELMDIDALSTQSNNRKRAAGARLIPGWNIPVDRLQSFDADMSFSGRRVVLSGLEFKRLSVRARLQSGRLQVKPRGGLYSGTLDGQLDLDARTRNPRLLLEIRGTKVNMSALLNALKNKRVMSGATGQLYIRLEGAGPNTRAMAASMNGRFLTSVGPGQIYNSAIKRIGADALMQLVRTFDPTDKSDKVTSMQCGVIFFDVKKGIARTERGIAAETKRMNVIGSGTINLGTEAVDLALRVQPRDGVGLSAGALGNVVRVGGTLASPAPSMDAVGALKTGASVGAAVATSGISLLVQGLFNRVTADKAPCKTALKVKHSRPKAAPQPSSRTPSDRG